ncbi:hypothetical protein PC116_g27788, partial [Phytophthora cactorum]
ASPKRFAGGVAYTSTMPLDSSPWQRLDANRGLRRLRCHLQLL